MLRPAHEPHLLQRQVLRLPAQGVERARESRASSEAVAVRDVVHVGARQSAEGPDARSKAGSSSRFGWRLYKHFFKTYNEKLWGVPVNKLPADFAAQRIKNLSLFERRRERADAEAQPEGHHVADRGVPVPEARPGHDVGALPRPGRGDGLHGGDEHARSSASATRTAGRVAVVGQTHDGARTEYPCDHVDLVDADLAARCWRWSRRPDEPAVEGGARPSLSRLPHGRAGGAASSTASPTTGSTCTRRTCRSAASRTSGRGRRIMVKEGRTCLGLEFFVFEGDETWNKPDAELVEQGKRELGILGLVDPAKVEAGYVVRMPKAYPFYDEHYKRQRRADRRVAECARRERASGRAQRHAPLQQPGPLDVHGDADRREHRDRHEARRVERQRRRGVPRGGGEDGGRSASRYARDGARRAGDPAGSLRPRSIRSTSRRGPRKG